VTQPMVTHYARESGASIKYELYLHLA